MPIDILLYFICIFCGGLALPNEISVGGLFEDNSMHVRRAFRYAVESVNDRKDVLPSTTLVSDIQTVQTDDSYHTSRKLCRQTKMGISAVFGPMSSLSSTNVQSVCNNLDIPHFETIWDFTSHKDHYSVNLHPNYHMYSMALLDLIKKWGWKKFTLLYDGNTGLLKVEQLLRASSEDLMINIIKIQDDLQPIMKDIKTNAHSHIVVDCNITDVYRVLKQALMWRMLDPYRHFFFTTLDLHMVNLDEFRHAGTNITAFTLIDPSKPQYVRKVWDELATIPEPNTNLLPGLHTQDALMYDAVQVFASAFDKLTKIVPNVAVESLPCSKPKKWDFGDSLLNYIRATSIEGITGEISFDNMGKRRDFNLYLVDAVSGRDMKKIGTWNSSAPENARLNMTNLENKSYKAKIEQTLLNRTLIVTTVLENPYTMLKVAPPGVTLKGNDRFYGYIIDLLELIAEKIPNFKYTIKLAYDGNYGAPIGNGKWNGMIKELMEKKADMAVASMTITYLREQVIDFTKPFMNLGISILYKRPENSKPSLFSFMSPLSIEIWIYMLTAYLGVSFMIFVLARFSPYEWYNPHPCNPESDVVENQFTVLNSLWFTIGSLMQQGSDIAPKSTPTRLLSSLWYFFTLIMISSYTANLAAFLTVERMNMPIENADDLAKQTKILYGTRDQGSTKSFFETSKIPTYERMWNFMEAHESKGVFVNDSAQGIAKVKEGNYAYLMESTMLEYAVERDCKLMQIGGLLDSKGYGIGTPLGSPMRDKLSNTILKLQEEQKLQILYNKWWKEKDGGGQCNKDDSSSKKTNSLDARNVGGVFVVLLGGLALAIVTAILEFIWKARKNASEDKQSICSEMLEELRFAVRCTGSSKKPAAKKTSTSFDGLNSTTLYPQLNGINIGKETYA